MMKNRREFIKQALLLSASTAGYWLLSCNNGSSDKNLNEDSFSLENNKALAPPPKGFFIRLVESGSRKYLSFQPQQVVTLEESRAAAITWFNAFLYDLPNKTEACESHFKQIYKTLPRGIDYFYGVETHYNFDGNPINKFCFPIGAGENVVDAYSTYLLYPHIESSRENVFSESGHFVKAKFAGEEVQFEKLVDDYALQKKAAFVKSREKLKKISMEIAIDESPLPSILKYSQYWISVTTKYQSQLESVNAYSGMAKLNNDFLQAELAFYNNVKIYREYKFRQAEAGRNVALISLILQGASIVGSMYEASNRQRMNSEIGQLKENEAVLTKEISKASSRASENLKLLNELKTHQMNELRRQNIPLNDDPKIDIQWQNLLH
jgi:hypothetical protein